MAYLIAKFLLSVFYAQEVYMTEVCWSKNYRDNGEDPSGGGAYDSTGISDVIEVIQEIDPDFSEPSGEPTRRPQPAPMFNDLGQVPVTSQPPHHSSGTHKSKPNAEVIITEQPASKALRFRYECEGRSAGSIPGASSTPENKTFPTIQVVGYRGRAVVVASCVTKDSPYMVHPHNLVGKEGCKKGVCTLMISPDTMTAQFQNLGIQCVKKRDIESSLRQREQIRVDPFKAGYNHKNQPIDLNAVRLCFQVFLEADKTGKFTVPLRPVVSDVIYDKKAMSDLTIIKLSDCVSHVDGGRKDIIILCEKVAKEDIEVHFYEESAKKVRVWEAKADFQPSQVHKQHAIWFRPPRYHTLDITEPVKVFIQLYRPSDHVTSEPVPFQFLPLESGRTPYWSYRRGMAKKVNYELFNSILTNDSKLLAKRQLLLNNASESPHIETNNNNIPGYAEVKKPKMDDDVILVTSTSDTHSTNEEKSFNEIINEVAELDEIYSDTRTKLLTDQNEKPPMGPPQDESFDDSRTYTSLQLAFKNPVSLINNVSDRYEDVIINPPSPKINVAPTAPNPIPSDDTGTIPPSIPPKRDTETSLPPLPPKRTKKIETYIGGSMTSIQLTGKQADILLTRSGSMKSTSVSRSQSFNLQRPKSHGELSPPVKRLPPVPDASATLPNPKKRGFFSKLFKRRSSKCSIQAPSREVSVTPSYNSTRSLQVDNTLSKSSGNISTHSGNSIRIRLKDESPPPNSPPPLFQKPIMTVAPSVTPHNFDEDMDIQLDLTEAENYALYTAMAPHATQSEFDEFSCYYAPVEGGKLLTNAEVAARLAGKS